MGYDKDGLGFSELTFIAIQYPTIYQIIETLLDQPREALELARKVITAHNLNLIDQT